jgi:hypothetical protein
MTQEERLGEMADELLDQPPPELGISNDMLRQCIKIQSDEALSLCRECGVEVP